MATPTMLGRWAGSTAPASLLRRLALAALSAAAVAAVSPWSGSSAPAAAKLAELVLSVLIWEAAMALGRRAEARAFGRAPVQPPVRLAGLVLAASLPATAAMLLIFALLGDPVSSPVSAYGQSLALGLLIAFARFGLRSAQAEPTAGPACAPAVAAAPPALDPSVLFLRRHAPKLSGRRLLALEAEDHYLRLHTDGGSALVLLRITDAVAALGPDAGWRPHRSFWLAAGVPATPARNGQAWTLTLDTGLVVPVSRPNAGAMRAAGYGQPPATPLPPAGPRAT